MCPQIARLGAGLVACIALWAAPAAQAGEVMVVDGASAVYVDDPFVPAGPAAELGREPRAGRAGAQAAAIARTSTTRRGRRAVLRALRRARGRGVLSRSEHRRHRRFYALARSRARRLDGARARELGSVVATLESIARRRRLTASRMPALFLILRRNAEFWPRSPFPASGDRIRFRGTQMLFQYYPGSGLQLQPLVNFKEANLLHGACEKRTGPCRRRALRRLLRELVRTSARRGGFRAWEYYFGFGGGAPPWMSGMAQATAIQAFARASKLLDEPRWRRYARQAFDAFETPPPTGIATTGPAGGTHYLQYSFAPRLFIINAFLQAVIGLYDYAQITGDATARRLYAEAEAEARRELPLHDIGDWTVYSYRGRESTREYHELLREFAASLCGRLRRPVYCDAARRFADYTTEPAQLRLLGPDTVRKGAPARVRFSLSKLSAVQLTITRRGRTVYDRTESFRRGEGSFGWTPRGTGPHRVRLAAKELRTGRALRTRVSGTIESAAR